MQKEGPVAGHATSVVHHRGDIADGESTKPQTHLIPPLGLPLCVRILTHDSADEDSLSVGFQLTDLEEGHEVVLGVAGPGGGALQSAELGGRH